jgi:hypothetical protein
MNSNFKKYLALTLILVIGTSCRNELKEKQKVEIVSLQKNKNNKIVVSQNDDFSDLKKKEEKCDTEEELLKKQFEKKEKSKTSAIKLQGGNDPGCSVK